MDARSSLCFAPSNAHLVACTLADPVKVFHARLLRVCGVPDDSIDPRRFPLFLGREVMRRLIDDLRVTV